jgi:hypothetical protein
MNERIRELWRDCVLKHTNDPMNWQMAADEFAELIIRECSDIADKAEPYKANDLIKQHFGVEDKSIKVGSRIKVVSKFNVGARGTVNYIEPTGKLWVRRDGASSDVSYYPTEVIGDD